MKNPEIPLLVLRVCCALVAAWLYPNAFWHGGNTNKISNSRMEEEDSYSLQRPPLGLFALHEIAYFVIRMSFFYKSNKRYTFSADERKAKPQLPTWILVAVILGSLVNLFACSAVLVLPGDYLFQCHRGHGFGSIGFGMRPFAHVSLPLAFGRKLEQSH